MKQRFSKNETLNSKEIMSEIYVRPPDQYTTATKAATFAVDLRGSYELPGMS